jgi:hypothetical protein
MHSLASTAEAHYECRQAASAHSFAAQWTVHEVYTVRVCCNQATMLIISVMIAHCV